MKHGITKNLANSKLLFTATIFATSVGGGTSLGLPEKVYLGYIYYPIALIISIIGDILFGKFLAPRIKKYHVETAGEILAVYYGKIGNIVSGICTIITSISFLIVQIWCIMYILIFFYDISKLHALIVSYILLSLHTGFKGINYILFSHVVQFFTIILTIPLISILICSKIHDLKLIFFIIKQYNIKYHLLDYKIIKTTLVFCLMSINPAIIQRTYFAQNANIIKQSIYIKSIFYFLLITSISFNAIVAQHFFPEITPWQATPYLIKEMISSKILELTIVIGFLSTMVSTADAEINITATSLKNNIIPILNIHDKYKNIINIKILSIIISLLALGLSIYMENIIDLIIFSSHFWIPLMVPPIICTLYQYKIRFFTLFSFITFIVTVLSHLLLDNYVSPLIVGLILNIVLILLTNKYNKKYRYI